MKGVNLTILPLMLLLAFSCNEPDDAWPRKENLNPPFIGAYSDGYFVINEGNFGWGYGTLTFVDAESGVPTQDLYRSVNGKILGNVVQSMTYHKGNYYIVVNNSQKIEVVDAKSFAQVGTIEGLVSPRYLLPISDSEALVSDLYEDSISIVNLRDWRVVFKMFSGGHTEKMQLADTKVFVCAPEMRQVLVVDVATKTVIAQIDCPGSPNSLQMDLNDNLWVLCGSDVASNASLIKVNTSIYTVEGSYEFVRKGEWPTSLSINSVKDRLYYLNGGVYSFDVMTPEIREDPLIPEGSSLFYGLGVDNEEDIFVADAIDYVQAGNIYQFSLEGVPLDTVQAGVIPGDFLFTNRIQN